MTKVLNNHQVKLIKDAIIAHPNAIIYNRDKLKYIGDTNSKLGALFHKFQIRCMGGATTYYVSQSGVIHRSVQGKLIPLDHKAFCTK